MRERIYKIIRNSLGKLICIRENDSHDYNPKAIMMIRYNHENKCITILFNADNNIYLSENNCPGINLNDFYHELLENFTL